MCVYTWDLTGDRKFVVVKYPVDNSIHRGDIDRIFVEEIIVWRIVLFEGKSLEENIL